MKQKVHVIISGLVQGVWFRSSTKNTAEQLHITGWVKNISDGKVEAIFEGEEKPGDDLTELKWVNPKELEDYFTTSFHKKLKEYLIDLV